MKILSLAMVRYSGDTPEPIILHSAQDVSSFGFFQRSGMREMLIAVTRILAKRVRGHQIVVHEGHKVYCEMLRTGLGCFAVCDMEYPARVATTLNRDMLKQFQATHGNKWEGTTKDDCLPFPALDKALAEYQDPKKVDKLMKIQADLEETKEVLHDTIDKVLQRGEKLDDLVEKSADLSAQSKVFYKQAKKTNSCCTIM